MNIAKGGRKHEAADAIEGFVYLDHVFSAGI